MAKITQRLLLLVLMMMVPMLAMSQVLVEQYEMETGVDSTKWIPISGTAPNLLPNGGDDEISAVTSMGFNFMFGGSIYSSFSVNTNGNLTLGDSATTGEGSSLPFGETNINTNLPKIDAMGCNGRMGLEGYAKYEVIGTAPNRVLVVEFCNGAFILGSATSDLSWQVQLYESSNEIQIVYGDSIPFNNPSSFQIGMASSASDVLTINTTDGTMSMGVTETVQTQWPSPHTYYRFYTPSCIRPAGVEVIGLTATSVNFKWHIYEGQTEWQYVCAVEGVVPDWDDALTSNDSVATIDELIPNTDYIVYVRNVCNGNDVSNPVQVKFHTDCTTIETPYFEDFDMYDAAGLPVCWTELMGVAEIKNNSGNSKCAYSGENCLYLRSSALVAAPIVKLAADEMMLVCQIRCQNFANSGTIDVGYVSDLSTMDFVTVKHIVPEHVAYQKYVIDFSDLDISDTVHIAFRQNSTSTWNGFYIDDISIVKSSQCPLVEYAYVRDITHNSAVIEWNGNVNVSSYEVAYNTIDDVNTATIVSVPLSENTLMLGELTPNTNYYTWVRNVGDIDTSMWFKVPLFKTKSSCASVINAELVSVGNTTASICWELDNSYGSDITGVEVAYKKLSDLDWTEVAIASNQNYCILQNLESSNVYQVIINTLCGETSSEYDTLQFQTIPCGVEVANSIRSTTLFPFGGASKYAYSQMLYPASELSDIDTIRGVSFKIKTVKSQTRNIDVYIGATSQDIISKTSYIDIDSMHKVVTDLDVDLHEGWLTIMFDSVFVYDGTSNIVLSVDDNTGNANTNVTVYYSTSIGSTVYKRTSSEDLDPNDFSSVNLLNYHGVPNVIFVSDCENATCAAPIVSFNEITTNSVTLNWTASAQETAWVVEYKMRDEEEWSPTSVSTTTYTITDLLPGTYYDIRVGTICGTDTLYTPLQIMTDCSAYEIPFIENFDDAELTCWVDHATMPNTNGKGKCSAGVYDFGTSVGSYIITPELEPEVNSLQVSFKIRKKSEYNNSGIIIMAGTDPNNYYSFVPIDTIYAPTITMTDQLCPLDSYLGTGHYIMFCGFTGYVYIDDINIDVLAECSTPSDLAVSNITNDAATITWVDNGATVNEWLVSYTKYGESTPMVENVSYDNGPSYVISGLEGNTQYEVTIITVCTNGDSNEAMTPVSFVTECDEIVLPYLEDFEGMAMNDFHPCWYRDEPVLIYNFEIPYWDIYTPAIFVGEHEGNTMVLCDNKSFVSPRVPLAGNEISLNFDLKIQDTVKTGGLVIGFATNPTDSLFTIIDTLSFKDNDWHNCTVDFTQLNSTDTGYVVFKNVDNISEFLWWTTNYYMMWIDNVDISKYNNCVRPYSPTITNITSTTAEVSFSDSANVNNYTVAWNTEKNIATATTLTTTSTTAQITNLDVNTLYYVWVRSDCSADQHSSWAYAGNFTTNCTAQLVPYQENFDDYYSGVSIDDKVPAEYPNHAKPNCWTIIGNTAYTSATPYSMISSYYAVEGNGFFAKADEHVPLYMVLPAFEPTTDSLKISFSYRTNNIRGDEDEFVLGVMSDPGNLSTFIPLEYLRNTTSWTTVDHYFLFDESVMPNTHYYIVFRYGGTSNNAQKLGIDNILVDYISSCFVPINVKVSDVATTTADITWQGTASSYQVNYREANADTWNSMVVTSNNATLANLNISSDYEVRVRAICGNADSSAWSNVLTFHTMCSAVAIPWSENFETYTTGIATNTSRPTEYPNHTLPDCWNFSEQSTSANSGPAIWLTSAPNTGTIHYNSIDGVSMKFQGHRYIPACAILPAMAENLDTLVLNFDYVANSLNAKIVLGVVTNPYDTNTFIPLSTYRGELNLTSIEHAFVYDNLDATQDYYIAFKVMNSNVVIDNLTIDFVNYCLRPGGLTTLDVTNNSALLTWGTTADSSEVRYHAMSDTAWTNVVSYNDSILLSGLSANTTYEVIVRSLCANGSVSPWSDTLQFTTECNVYPLPFIEEFERLLTMNDLICWEFYVGLADEVMNGLTTLTPRAAIGSEWKNISGTNALESPHTYIEIDGIDCADWMVSPTIALNSSAELSFDIAYTSYYDPLIPASNFSDDKFYVLATIDDGATWTKLMTWGGDTTYFDNLLDSLHITADTVIIPLTQFANQNIRIAFYGESTVYGGDNNLHIDNIKILESSINCLIPTNITTTVDDMSATLTWEGGSQDYEIDIRHAGEIDWGEPIAVTGTTYTFANLDPNTAYEYRLRQVCAENVYSDWVSGVFTTLELPCAIPTITVQEVTGDGAIITWEQGENNSSWEVNVYNTVMNESYDATETSYTITGLEHGIEYNVAVRAKCAENIYSDWSDTLQFTTIDCYPVTNVAANEITENSAVITWTAGGSETQWEINYGEIDFGQGEGIFQIVNATTYTITGLEAETDYDVYVRAICGEDFNSTWSEPVCQFQTLSGDTPEGIDGVDGNYQLAIYPNPTSGATTIRLNGVEGQVTISIVDMNGRTIENETIECGSDCEKRLDVTNLSQGTYFVRVLGDNINSVRKLIVR